MNGEAWKAGFSKKLVLKFGEKKGAALYKKYSQAFDTRYCEEGAVERALSDLPYLEKLSNDNFLELDFYRSPGQAETCLHLRIYQWKEFIPLSDLLPILSNLDFRVFSERSYKLTREDQNIWISDFLISSNRGLTFDFDLMRELMDSALLEICLGRLENDGLNQLILGAGLSWREVALLRAYTKYLRQVGFRFSQDYIQQALANNTPLVRQLIQFFMLQHHPQQKPGYKNQRAALEKKILQDLERVTSLDEDLVIRRLLVLIKATVRSNYFQAASAQQATPVLSFKLQCQAIPELPLPVPLFEIFVYSPRFEAVHLRGSRVARGGIRWSDRREDFRTEILGLMKAQHVKNAIIVPSGAKGGFVLKTAQPGWSRELLQKEVVECYTLFIRSLLDLTDNLKDNKVLRPKAVLCHDEPDPYLVVAADKGTASFSDLANALAKDCQFWLGDAFASGGATGYDHKKMGITARGAWESVKRHFRALDIDLEKATPTLVGIGDMSGDVFGNGLLYSRRLRLLAAFDHRHIFLDPNPNADLSYQERLRLFRLPGSSWEDYNPRLLSAGGGVYKRSAKSIPLSPEVRKMLDVKEENLMPNDLVRAILRAPVDLLWNGGIGTYVKASNETHAEVGDKTNDGNRVNGNELRCKVVGEGGNLGFTQRGRIEYALNQGLINTDFIDNSAGVDCSDHEVNLKILLNSEVVKGRLSEKRRNQLLMQVGDEVAALVLKDNDDQAWALGFLNQYSYGDTGLYQGYMTELEASGFLNRQMEYLPDNKTLVDRHTNGVGLTTPELAVLLSYTKIHLKHELLKSDLPEDPYFARLMETAFPASIYKLYPKAGQEHRLRREIIATQWSSRMVNEMGAVFVYRLQNESGFSVADIVRAYAVTTAIFDVQPLRRLIQALDFKLPLATQYQFLHHIRHLINISSRWFLHENRLQKNLPALIEHYRTRVQKLENMMLHLMTGFTKAFMDKLLDQFIQAKLSPEIAAQLAATRVAYITLNIIEVATVHRFDLEKTARVYFAVGERFNLVWFRDHIANDVREGSWNALARLTLRDELDGVQKALTVETLKISKKEADISQLLTLWAERNTQALARWEKLLRSIHESTTIEYSMFFIALRELGSLIAECAHPSL